MIKLNINRPSVVAMITASALFMEHLDGTIIATALPTISRALDANPLHLSLAMTSYMLSLAMFIPLSGWMADKFGARTVFCAAVVVFTVGSLASGLSFDLTSLVFARFAQGMGGAMMTPVGRLILLRSVPRAQLVDALATMSAAALIGPLLGPPIGGMIVTYVSWRWIFLVNLPIGIVGFMLARRYIDNVRDENAGRFDWPGFMMIAPAMAGIVFGCETAGRHMLPAYLSSVLLIVSVALIVLYILYVRARAVREPLIDPSILGYKTYWASVFGGSLFRIATGAISFLLPVMLQVGFGISQIVCGWLLIAGAFGAIQIKFAAKTILRRWGFRNVLIVNGLLCAAFFAVYAALAPQTPLWAMVLALMAGGVVRSLQFTSLNAVAYADMPERLLSRANTLYTTLQQLTLGLGIAFAAMMVDTTSRAHGHVSVSANDFWPSYLMLSGLTVLSTMPFVRIASQAGSDVSNHRTSRSRAVTEAVANEQE